MCKMVSKTIKISEDNYRWLLNIAAELQKERGRLASFDDALDELKEKDEKKGDIMELAGSWKMSDKEAEKLLNEIYKERKISSRRI